jgi:uncharacterized repeat protein (TIGR02543 family)
MYFAPDQMPKLYAVARRLQGDKFVEVLGIQDYTIELIGTNADLDKISVIYYDINNRVLGSKEVYLGTQYMLGNGITVTDTNGNVFNGSWSRGSRSGSPLLNNSIVNATLDTQGELNSRTIRWYAQYRENKQFNLSFSYGLGEPLKDNYGNDILSIKFIPNQDTISSAIANEKITLNTGEAFTSLPLSPNPIYKETINGKEETWETHLNRGWYLGDSTKFDKVTNDTELKVENNMIIYQVFEPVKNNIKFESNGGTSYTPLTANYGEKVAIPTPYKQGYVFSGWYLDSEFKKAFNGTMLPYPITLYAKWE